MNKHTPAPWKSTFQLNNERGVRNSGGYICFLPKPHRYSGQDERYENELKEYEANAKLIAAAPELLEALNRVNNTLTVHGKVDSETPLHEFILAAIKKATE